MKRADFCSSNAQNTANTVCVREYFNEGGAEIRLFKTGADYSRYLMNIYDIAEKCGVSIATVSRVLNNNPNVSAATRAKIQAVIDEANYIPSELARKLGNNGDAPAATGSIPAVGVLCSRMQDPYYGPVLAGLEAALTQRGLALLLADSGTTPAEEEQALNKMLGYGVSAIVYLNPLHYDQMDHSPLTAAAQTVPVILVDGVLSAPGVYSIYSDRKTAVAQLVEAMMRRQRRRVLFLYDQSTHDCRQQLEGYRQAVTAAGLTYDPALTVQVDSDIDKVNQCIKRLLVNRVTFDAVIGAEDILALGAQKALLRTGLNMPIIGFGNSLIARCANPELTSVDCGVEKLSNAAISVMDALLAGKQPDSPLVLPTTLIERDTFRNA